MDYSKLSTAELQKILAPIQEKITKARLVKGEGESADALWAMRDELTVADEVKAEIAKRKK